jgi:hypothetical protein
VRNALCGRIVCAFPQVGWQNKTKADQGLSHRPIGLLTPEEASEADAIMLNLFPPPVSGSR